MSSDEWSELNREFDSGRKSWFGRLGDARQQVAKHLTDDERVELDFLADITNRLSNMTLHNTVRGLLGGSARPLQYQGRVFLDYSHWREAPEVQMRLAFFSACSCYTRIAVLILEEFGIDVASIVEAEANARRAILELMPSKRRKLGRNDLCWWGSGAKLKACHGL